MPLQKYDYLDLRMKFITADPPISINELCRQNGVLSTSTSAVNRRAREEDWLGLREKRAERSTAMVVEETAHRKAARVLRRMEVEDNAIEAIDEAISKMRSDMKRTKKVRDPETQEFLQEPAVTYRPEQVVQLIDRVKGLFGGGPAETDGKGDPSLAASFNFNFDGDSPEHRALATQLVGATRGAGGPTPGSAGGSPLPSSPGAGEDQ